MRDSIFVKEEITKDDLDHMLWSGAKQRWNSATEDQKDRVWDSLMESVNVHMDSTGDIPTKTEVNDFIWFECDDIFNEKEEDTESYSRRCRRGSRTESLRDPVEPETAEELRNYAINNSKRWIEDIVIALAKKASRGIDLNEDKLKNSSMMDSLIRDVIHGYEKDFYPHGEKMDISTATRKLLKQKLAGDILEQVKDLT